MISKVDRSVVARLCICGCGGTVKPTFNKLGKNTGYRKCIRGHHRPWTEPQRAAFAVNRLIHVKPLGSKRLRSVGRGNEYVEIKVAESGRWMLEHRYIMEKELGRKLRTDEHVHHINGDTQDNRRENLQVMAAGDHARIAANENIANRVGLFKEGIEICPTCKWRHPLHK